MKKVKNKQFTSDLFKKYAAFTLAEVLITLGIIGIVAALTIPALINKTKDTEYKTAYKKAYSTFYQAFNAAKSDGDLIDTTTPTVTGKDDGGNNLNLITIMKKFKVIKACTNVNNSSCWDSSGEQFGKYYASDGRPGAVFVSFIDSSGMAWTALEWTQGRVAVDTNGFKKPNQYGKDRFAFEVLPESSKNDMEKGIPATVAPYPDNDYGICDKNACGTTGNKDYNTYYGTSWLYN